MGDTREEFAPLFETYVVVGLAVFLIILILVVFVVVRFRASSGRGTAGGGEDTTDSRTPVELMYAGFLTLIVAALLVLTYNTMDDLQAFERRADGPLVEVTAAKWNWRFAYPELGVAQDRGGPLASVLVVPVDAPVRFRMRSVDVIHTFWVPERRFKRDAFPGRTTEFVLRFPDAGFKRRAGECNQFCGLGHADMEFDVLVLPRDEFDSWVRERRKES